MGLNRIRCNAFEKTDGAPERCGIGPRPLQSFDPDHRHFIRIMQNAAAHNFAELEIHSCKWPIPPGGILNAEKFQFLDDPSYRADFQVCFVASLYEVGPEVAHLILDRRKCAMMVLIVSDQPVTSEFAAEFRKGVSAIAESAYVRSEGSIVVPTMYDGATHDAESGGKISCFSVCDRADAQRRLEEIFV